MTRYEIYRTDQRTGNKKKIGDVSASSAKMALKKMGQMTTIRKGNYLVIPIKIRAKYSFRKG